MDGQTEAAARISYLSPSNIDKKLGSIGKAIPGGKIDYKGSKKINDRYERNSSF